MQRKKAVEIVGYRRRRGKTIGYMIWMIMLVIGIIGVIFWKWYTLILTLIAGFIFGSIFSYLESKRIERITGLNIHEQHLAYSESLAAKLDPITRDPAAYRKYIDSIPDELEIVKDEEYSVQDDTQ